MATITWNRRQRGRVRAATSALAVDYWMLLAIAGLIVIGMLTVYSTTFDLGMLAKDDSTYYIKRQAVALGLGLATAVILLQFDYHFLRYLSVPLMLLSLAGLLFVLFFGETIFGARLGISEGSYQPSELAKLATILYIAHWLSSKGERIKIPTYGLIPFSVIVGVVCAIMVRQPDLGTATLVAIVSFTMFFIAGADWRQFTIAGLIGGAAFVFLMFALPHAAERIGDYTVTLRDPDQASYHVQQALIALGRGRLFGVGLGASTQKFGALPAAHTDGAFAILGEELGLFGTLLVIGLFALLVWRGLLAASRARDSYGFLLAVGITCWLAYQSLINIAVITAVMPFTGIPLPFISYGGSSLLISVIGMGILLNISRDAAVTRGRKMKDE